MNYHKTQTPQMNSNEAADALGVKFEHSIISTVNFRNEISIEIKLEQSFEILSYKISLIYSTQRNQYYALLIICEFIKSR